MREGNYYTFWVYIMGSRTGSMVIVPSSAVETMGLGASLATAAIAGAKP